MNKKIIWKFLSGYILLILIAVLVLNFFVSLKLRDYYELKISEQLISNSLLVAKILKSDLLAQNQGAIQQKTQELAKELKVRITVIDKNGRVWSDSEASPERLENHNSRLEVVRAIEKGVGESNRYSDTVGYNMKYVAFSVKENGRHIAIVRLAMPLKDVESQIRFIYRVVLIGGIIAIIFVFILGYFISRSIVTPITQMKEIAQAIAMGDFSKRMDVKANDELGVLAKSLNTMADELQLKIDNLRKMDKVRTDFVANVSHELKTPLTSIKGFIETLEDGAIDDKENAARFIAIIKKHADNLSNIINDLLSLSEFELGKDKLDRSEFDLRESVEEVGLGFNHALAFKKQVLEKNFLGENFLINADKTKIEQVLVNLIDNAIKYSAEGKTIKIDIADKGKDFLISIQDSGIGIPREHLSRIFERFYRVDKARSRRLGGTGLGLAIVKHIIILHGGSIDIESEPGIGTKVSITLPKT